MTLPIDSDEQLKDEQPHARPNDPIYASIKEYLPYIAKESKELKERLVDIIVEDMILDHSLSNALDEVGKILEYQAQNEGIEKPQFSGLSILKDAERIGRLRFVLNLCEVVGLDDQAVEGIRLAEIEKLWGDSVHLKEKKETGSVLKLPDEIVGLLRELTKNVSKRKEASHERNAGPGRAGKRTSGIERPSKGKPVPQRS